MIWLHLIYSRRNLIPFLDFRQLSSLHASHCVPAHSHNGPNVYLFRRAVSHQSERVRSPSFELILIISERESCATPSCGRALDSSTVNGPRGSRPRRSRSRVRTAFLGENNAKLNRALDPGNGKEIGTLPDQGVEDVKLAVDNAHAAFASWGKTTEYERHAILMKLFKSAPPLSVHCTCVLNASVDSCRRTTRISLKFKGLFQFRGEGTDANARRLSR